MVAARTAAPPSMRGTHVPSGRTDYTQTVTVASPLYLYGLRVRVSSGTSLLTCQVDGVNAPLMQVVQAAASVESSLYFATPVLLSTGSHTLAVLGSTSYVMEYNLQQWVELEPGLSLGNWLGGTYHVPWALGVHETAEAVWGVQFGVGLEGVEAGTPVVRSGVLLPAPGGDATAEPEPVVYEGRLFPAPTYIEVTGPEPEVQTVTLSEASGAFATPDAFNLLTQDYSDACRFRLYRTAAGRTADADRPEGTEYPGGRELVYEYIAQGPESDESVPFVVARETGETGMYYLLDGAASVVLTFKET